MTDPVTDPQVCPRRPSPPERPYRRRNRAGDDVVVNPNECGICRRPKHPHTPHHRFAEATELEPLARRLGWIS